MTERTAYVLLAGPLRFGDEAQLAAVRFLREVADFRLRVMRCRRCQGEGVNRRGYACPWCAAGYSADVLRACGIEAKEEGESEEARGMKPRGKRQETEVNHET